MNFQIQHSSFCVITLGTNTATTMQETNRHRTTRQSSSKFLTLAAAFNDAEGGPKVKVAAHAADALAPSCNSVGGSSSKRTNVAVSPAGGSNGGLQKGLKHATASR